MLKGVKIEQNILVQSLMINFPSKTMWILWAT